MKTHWVGLLLLCGCATERPASVGQGPERRFTGTVEKTAPSTRGGVSQSAVMPLAVVGGAIGGALAGLASADRSTHQHTIKLDSGMTIGVLSDDEFNIGDCVRVVVNDYSAEPLPWYSYGQARIDRVACATPSQ